MTCPVCKAQVRIVKTQSDSVIDVHPLPVDYRDLNIKRRRYICLSKSPHRFWTIEVLEELWVGKVASDLMEEKGV